jgi:hypothetical protein
VSFGSNSLWAAVISLDGFDSNILVSSAAILSIGSSRSNIFGEIRHQFSLGSCGNNIWCDNNLPDVEIIYLAW